MLCCKYTHLSKETVKKNNNSNAQMLFQGQLYFLLAFQDGFYECGPVFICVEVSNMNGHIPVHQPIHQYINPIANRYIRDSTATLLQQALSELKINPFVMITFCIVLQRVSQQKLLKKATFLQQTLSQYESNPLERDAFRKVNSTATFLQHRLCEQYSNLFAIQTL